jgi:hypothetical protein
MEPNVLVVKKLNVYEHKRRRNEIERAQRGLEPSNTYTYVSCVMIKVFDILIRVGAVRLPAH